MNRRSAVLSFAAVLALLLPSSRSRADEVFPVVHTEPITVQLVRGADGKPWAHQQVVLTGGYDRHDLDVATWRLDAITDDAGKVQLSNSLRNLPWVRVESPAALDCGPDEAVSAYSVELIRRDGLSGPNRCGVVITPNAPGVLTIYVTERIPVTVKLHALAVRAHLRRKPKVQRAQSQQARLTPQPAPAAKPESVQTVWATQAPLTDAEMEALLAQQP